MCIILDNPSPDPSTLTRVSLEVAMCDAVGVHKLDSLDHLHEQLRSTLGISQPICNKFYDVNNLILCVKMCVLCVRVCVCACV